MFNSIAHRYDFLNHFLSLGIDRIWRRKAIRKLESGNPGIILDLATGTADLAIAAARLHPRKIIGIDISEKMLELGRQKVVRKRLEDVVFLQKGDSEHLDFADRSFDAVMVAFGVRNFENTVQGISEMYRVLKPGGRIVVLEFSFPQKFPVKQLYNFYFSKILPAIGRLFSRDSSAYQYLPESVDNFLYGEPFLRLLENEGFTCLYSQSLSFGIAQIYSGKKEIHNKLQKD